ncbi:MAG: hypothetical protein PWQ70_3008 [Clostridiales bacterium]|jgi:predicted nucleic acid-binding protein|nr:hypothetical protein [Clostridiales bacterium]MDK2907277.1 hypothetical protein [Petrotoga sp.]
MAGAVPKTGANVLDINNSKLDGVIATDTNVLLYAFGYNLGMEEDLIDKNYYNRAKQFKYYNFIERLSNNETILIYTYTTINEIRTVVQKLVSTKKGKEIGYTPDEASKNWKSIFQKYKDLSSISNDYSNEILNAISSSPYIMYFEQDTSQNLVNLSGELLKQYPIDSNDATIIANALLYGVNSIASDEYNFKNISGINLYTANKKLINEIGQISDELIDYDIACRLYNIKKENNG